jgi:thiol-disulfide isomerase/thioredoxin
VDAGHRLHLSRWGSGGASADGTPAPGGGPDGADTALDFHGPTVDGQEFDGAALAGTPVVLWFWAPWCTICRAEAPDVAAVAAEYAGRVEVIGVAGRGDEAESARVHLRRWLPGATGGLRPESVAARGGPGLVRRPAAQTTLPWQECQR